MTTDNEFTIAQPPSPNWRVHLPLYKTTYQTYRKTGPNWFQRKMWLWCFDCRWEYIGPEDTK